MRIGIVEDEEVWQNIILNAVKECCDKNNISCDVRTYSSVKEFEKELDIELLFLDIELENGENGLDFAQQLVSEGNQCTICFLTSHIEFSREGYKVNAFRYIDKRHLNEIAEAIESFLKTKIQDRFIYCNDSFGISIKINLRDLVLIETSGRKLRYLMIDGSEHYGEGVISEKVKSLECFGFCQIQRSYIVNLKYIAKVNSREATLDNGIKVVIGRTHSKEFKKAFFEWRMQFGN